MAMTQATETKAMQLNGDTVPVFLPRRSRFILGCDLGQTSDPTAVSVIEHVRGVLDANTLYERHTNTGRIPQKPAERFYLKYLERLPLSLPYPVQIGRVAEILSRPPLCGDGDRIRPAELVVDHTGVGAAVSDLMFAQGLRPVRITITSGSEARCVGEDRFNVAKELIVSNLDACLHNGDLKFAAGLVEGHALKEELIDFRRHVGAAGRATYAAREGKHDDLVLSVGIPLWWARRPEPPPPMFGRYGSDGIVVTQIGNHKL